MLIPKTGLNEGVETGAKGGAALPWAHVALVAGAEAHLVEGLRQALSSTGTDSIFCAAPGEVRAALREKRFCYVLLAPAGKLFRSSGGEDLFDELRRVDGTVILLDGANDVGSDGVLEASRRRLHAAGCYDHRDCLRRREPVSDDAAPADGPSGGRVTVRVDGLRGGKRSGLLIDGKRAFCPDSRFIAFLKLANEHLVNPRAWSDLDHLRIDSDTRLYRLPDDVDPFVPEGYDLVQVDRGKFRMNPEARVAIDWKALVEHPNDEIREFARERLRRLTSR